jgi:hypothetical protein
MRISMLGGYGNWEKTQRNLCEGFRVFMQSEGIKEANMPKRSTRKARRRTRKTANQDSGFSLLGAALGLAVIAAGFAYAFGYLPQSFEVAGYNIELPKIDMPQLPHSNDVPKTN